MRVRHGIVVVWAEEALDDPEALRIEPDPASKSGRSVRMVGYSPSAGFLVTVITLTDGGTTYGVNAWRSSETDVRRYGEERT